MRVFRFVRLFWRIFGPAGRLDAAEIEGMGLLAVKIAQMYAVRSDLLGVEKSRKLQRLYEEATPLGFEEFQELFEAGANPALKRDLLELEREPLATASLGQVHGGRLKGGGEVIVKVVRGAEAGGFLADVAALRRLLKLAIFLYPKLERLADPLGTLAIVERLTVTEMDLRNELQGTLRLAEIRDSAGDLEELRRLGFPKLYEEYTTERVLVAERLRAPSVRRQLSEGSFRYESLLGLFRIHGHFLFHRGIFHGDLHPGNVHHADGRFWFIDNANVEDVPPEFTRGLLGFLMELGRGRFREAATALEDLAVEPLADNTVFVRAFENLYADFGLKPAGELSLTNQMMATVKLAVHSGLEFPKGAFPVIKSLMYLDGMALGCAPHKRLLEDVLTFGER